MCFSLSLLLATLAVQPLTAFGHILLAQPKPIGRINNSPINGPNSSGGGNYPCKSTGPSFYDGAENTNIPLGSNYTVKFTGSAVHGGGSCQFSLSKDEAPTASSIFKVIYSIQGGCPARNTPGNLGGDANFVDPFEYPFTMPADLEPGKYTFAWTWFNKVGNREFYMNCAAVDVTATDEHKGDPAYFDTLPNIALANVAGVDCVSEPDNGMGAFKYQYPGEFVETNENLQTVAKQCFAPIGGSGGSGGSGGDVSSDNGGAQNTYPTAAETTASLTNFAQQSSTTIASSTPATATMQPVSSNTFTANPGIFITKSQTSSSTTQAPDQPSTFITVTTTTGTTAATTSAEVPTTSPETNPSCPATWQSCTRTGFFCIDATHFGLCSSGCMPEPQMLSDGLNCDLATDTVFDARMVHSE